MYWQIDSRIPWVNVDIQWLIFVFSYGLKVRKLQNQIVVNTIRLKNDQNFCLILALTVKMDQIQGEYKDESWTHSSLLRTFVFFAISTYNSYLHQSLEQMHWFEAIFEIFAHAIFEAIEVKGRSMLNFEAVTLKFGNHFWKFGCQPRKSKTDLWMTNGSKVLIYLTLISFFLHYFKSKSLRNNKKVK